MTTRRRPEPAGSAQVFPPDVAALNLFSLFARHRCDEHDEATTLLLSDAGLRVAAIALDGDRTEVLSVQACFDHPLRRLGLAAVVNFSASPAGPLLPAWALVVVAPGVPALLLVRRLVDDPTKWMRIPMEEAPWFALSTAAGLRAAFDGQPLVLRGAVNPQLYTSPGQTPHPTSGDDGLL